MNDRDAARERYRQRVKAALETADEAFRGTYSQELSGLLGLSREEIDAITPDTTDLEVYDKLITVVKEASANNIAAAELKQDIMELGAIAVGIAKRVSGLSALF